MASRFFYRIISLSLNRRKKEKEEIISDGTKACWQIQLLVRTKKSIPRCALDTCRYDHMLLFRNFFKPVKSVVFYFHCCSQGRKTERKSLWTCLLFVIYHYALGKVPRFRKTIASSSSEPALLFRSNI